MIIAFGCNDVFRFKTSGVQGGRNATMCNVMLTFVVYFHTVSFQSFSMNPIRARINLVNE